MKIAFLHYHLKPGGVTTVIRHQVEALKDECRVLVLSGAPHRSPFPAPVRNIPDIAYDNDRKRTENPGETAASIHRTIQKQWKGGCDLLHVHNPTLAKNSAFLDILKALQELGVTLFLQIHDFAEDGRPLAYFPQEYPHDCHYGVINSRDYRILLHAGLKPEGLHKVFNPVKPLGAAVRPTCATEEILYPVRAIRRKNIGEALLLSLYFEKSQSLSITLPPNSPADLVAYQGWKRFAADNRLNIRFDAGLDRDFEELLNRSQYLLTTSITEGFGYAFLEAWTAGKPVWGRNLADITHDFTRKGLRLDHLYRNLLVPLSWIDHQRFFTRWKTCILDNSAHFGLHHTVARLDKIAEKMLATGVIDFGLLDESFQKRIIQALLAESDKKDRLRTINPFLQQPFLPIDIEKIIDHNHKTITHAFGTGAYKENLLETYRAVSGHAVKQRIDKHRLAASFFNLESFSLLKWRPYVE